MNKQEALEALLTKMREWEQPHDETKRVDDQTVFSDMSEAFGKYPEAFDTQAYLIRIGAAALYLLVDEVTVVPGNSLPDYLDPAVQHPPGRRSLFPVNGDIGRPKLPRGR